VDKGNQSSPESVERHVINGRKTSSVFWVALLVGSVGGATLSFLLQVLTQIPCHRVVITGPSCPKFTASIPALALGAVAGTIIAVSVSELVSRTAGGAGPGALRLAGEAADYP